MSFTRMGVLCFSSFTEYNFGFMNINAYSKYFITNVNGLNSAVKRTRVLEYLTPLNLLRSVFFPLTYMIM